MTAVTSVTGRVQPGRYDDFLAQTLEVAKLFERHGAREIRLLGAGAAGEASNSWVFSYENANMEAAGEFTDEIMLDLEMQSVLARTRASDAPTVIEQVSVATEVPLDRSRRPGRGNVVEVHVSRVVPGRLEQALNLCSRAFDFVEGHGATNARLTTIVAGGSGTGLFIATWECQNLRALGRITDAFSNEPAGQEIAMSVASTDNPVTEVFSGIYSEIPL